MKFEPSYVNAVLLSDDAENIVFLKKLSGPEFLIGKYNFVGGKQEPGETHLESIVREVKEEAGIDVSSNLFYTVDYREFEKDGKAYKLENFAAIVPVDILNKARTMEKEPVYHIPLKRLVADLAESPEKFNYDFKQLVVWALEKVPEEFANKKFNVIREALTATNLKVESPSKVKKPGM